MMMKASKEAIADGISIRVRVRQATTTSKLEYGEPQDMVCTIINWASTSSKRNKPGSPRRGNIANKFRSKSISKADSIGLEGHAAPTLVFQQRTQPGHTLEACCSLQSVSSYDSLDPSIMGDTVVEQDALQEVVLNVENNANKSTRNELLGERKRKMYIVPCNGIKTVERVSSLFRGYRVFFATGSRGSYELEFENKNGMDIMMAFLQANLPAERFVNLGSGSVDGSDTASYLSTLDVEKLTERLAEKEMQEETMSEKLKNRVGRVVSSIEEMTSSFCGNICCGSSMLSSSQSVAPYVPTDADEIRDSPPRVGGSKASTRFHSFPGPVMEIDEENSTQSSVVGDAAVAREADATLKKRMYLNDYKLPSGLSMEELPE